MSVVHFCEKYPIFFLHIPRTGGTTLDAIFFRNIPKEKILTIYSKREYEAHRTHMLEEVQGFTYITGHLLLEHYDPPQLYSMPVNVFTFLRDPVQRLVSEYIFYKTWKNQHLYAPIHERNMSFREYLVSTEKLFLYRGKNFMTRCISGRSFASGTYPYAALATAKRYLEKNFFFFGLLERFDESLVALAKILNLQTIFYERRNTLKQGTKDEITDADRELARELNRCDCDLYAFARDLFAERISSLGETFRHDVKKFQDLNAKYQKVSAALFDETHHQMPENGIQLSKDVVW